jgi:hypothetical protein
VSALDLVEGSRPYSTVIAERKDSCSRRGKLIVNVDADYLSPCGRERNFLDLASLLNPWKIQGDLKCTTQYIPLSGDF